MNKNQDEITYQQQRRFKKLGDEREMINILERQFDRSRFWGNNYYKIDRDILQHG